MTEQKDIEKLLASAGIYLASAKQHAAEGFSTLEADILIERFVAVLGEVNTDNLVLNHLFEIQYRRMVRVTKLWRKETGKHDVLPDLGVILEWLMGKIPAFDEAKQITTERG
jgi:hypothetical protein